jgi:SAM-dependent methyltransferase
MFISDVNELNRQAWLKDVLAKIPAGARLLDAGAGELKNRRHCGHLEYVSQDFGQYAGGKDEAAVQGLHSDQWDTSRIDLVCDITSITAPDASLDAILCSEVLEHVPEPTHALDEFTRLLKPGGMVVLTAPFGSNVHMAPYHFCSGFSRYWYEHHLTTRGFEIKELVANGDWYSLLRQEITRLGGIERQRGGWTWPLAYAYAIMGLVYFKIRKKSRAEDLACFGWHCTAIKKSQQ